VKITEVALPDISRLPYQAIVERIKNDCSEFLHECGGRMLYHGENGVNILSRAFVGTSKERGPHDASLMMQKAVDAQLSEDGFSALRNDSLFCTGHGMTAAEYGTVFYIFPLDGYTYTWSKEIDDLCASYPISNTKWKVFSELDKEYYDDMLAHGPTDSSETFEKRFHLPANRWKFFANSVTSGEFQFFYDVNNLSAENFVRKYEYENSVHLAEAIKSKHEICLKGSYYAVYAREFAEYAERMK